MRLRERLRYWFDGTMDRGTPALIGWLALASVVLIVVVTAAVVGLTWTEAEKQGSWGGVAWLTLMRAIDPGTMGGDAGSPVYLALMLTITIGGIFIVSSLIGVLTTGLENRIAELRKGRSKLIEQGHTIVLGWSEQIFTVIEELVKANQGQRRSCVVILADRDKVDMDDQIRARLGETGRTRVICRSGSALKRADLELVSPDTAKAIMVLPSPDKDADVDVIKALLLLNNRTWRGVRPHVVAAVQESENLVAARLAGGESAIVIDADDITVRLVAQSHRQSGLSTVCTDLLDFDGNEFYIRPEPALTGRTYGQAVTAYDRGIPVGLRRMDGRVVLNPAPETLIGAKDHVIVLAEDDLLIRLADSAPATVEPAIATAPDPGQRPDRTLLVGWNSRGVKLIGLLDRLVEPGSVVDIAAAHRPLDVLDTDRKNLTVGYKACRPTSRRSLESLDLGGYQNVVVLADDEVEAERADDRTLVTLLHLRDIKLSLGDPYTIVTEINDDANREIFQVTRADDFIVGTKLISLLLTQLAENRHLYGVFSELFDPAGSEIFLRPASHYLTPGVEANFATVMAAATRQGQTAIGYRLKRNSDQAPSYGVTLNPPKGAPLTLGADDQVIVLAEDV
ncbi:lipoprotein [Sphaerisporangium melleum]|uniref:Lipoprotein n=1 Tax=Sphaerisporangium melleum TaxID=321316 RepID=A0A917R0K3_9ACTN|nr:potassium transporter TrkA [Sphaerisporangium melleum]GGK81420.1 lipoprotein [Sphaerisporangium melleum]GII73849.1 lipoprotein [Sphaerisporangium melleum]